VKIRFQPKIRAYFQGTVILNSNAVNASKKSFDVSGYGFEPKPLISIQDTSLTFDNVFVDSTINKDFIVKNAGEQNLEFQSFILNDTTGTFKLSNTNLPRSLSPGESFPMHISFTPVEMKTYSANISILSDAYNSPKITINLTGICNGPKPVISTGFLILSVGSTEVGQHLDKAFNINNAGSGYLVIKSITTEKYMDSIFTFPDLNLPLQIMSNDSARVTIRFSPLEAKSYSTKLIIASNSYQDTLKKYLLNASGIITSIEEYTSNTSNIVLKVFPNPVIDSKITVLCNRYNLSYDNVPINLYNMEGLEVKKIGILKSGMEYLETDADVGDLSSGMYFIHATSSSGIVQVPFIILK
jgi:hypothetical protein